LCIIPSKHQDAKRSELLYALVNIGSYTVKPLVIAENLYYNRDDKVIFSGIDLKIVRGKITAIMGPSGAGKTTLLNLIGAQLHPDRGRVFFDGQELYRLKRSELYRARQRMGMLFQSGALFTNLNVFENVAFPLREHTKLSEELIKDLVLMKLEAVGLRGARYLMASQLSGGMARRVALARALIMDPELMMYDEPFTGQDPITMGVLLQLIKRLNDALGLTSIIVSHDVAETASIADYVYLISSGSIIAEGTPEAIFKDQSPAVRQFVHGLPDGVVPFHYPARDLNEDLFSD
jgi:phospholipid/cholesterol/gamma-HCH transport system ATP-binding protein